VLHRQRFGRAQQHVIERSLQSKMRRWQLDMRFVLRDMDGRGLLTLEHSSAGTAIQLTHMGIDAAKDASAQAKRSRRRS